MICKYVRRTYFMYLICIKLILNTKNFIHTHDRMLFKSAACSRVTNKISMLAFILKVSRWRFTTTLNEIIGNRPPVHFSTLFDINLFGFSVYTVKVVPSYPSINFILLIYMSQYHEVYHKSTFTLIISTWSFLARPPPLL